MTGETKTGGAFSFDDALEAGTNVAIPAAGAAAGGGAAAILAALAASKRSAALKAALEALQASTQRGAATERLARGMTMDTVRPARIGKTLPPEQIATMGPGRSVTRGVDGVYGREVDPAGMYTPDQMPQIARRLESQSANIYSDADATRAAMQASDPYVMAVRSAVIGSGTGAAGAGAADYGNRGKIDLGLVAATGAGAAAGAGMGAAGSRMGQNLAGGLRQQVPGAIRRGGEVAADDLAAAEGLRNSRYYPKPQKPARQAPVDTAEPVRTFENNQAGANPNAFKPTHESFSDEQKSILEGLADSHLQARARAALGENDAVNGQAAKPPKVSELKLALEAKGIKMNHGQITRYLRARERAIRSAQEAEDAARRSQSGGPGGEDW